MLPLRRSRVSRFSGLSRVTTRVTTLVPAALVPAIIGCGGSAVDPDLDYTLRHRPAATTDSVVAQPASTAPAAPVAMALSKRDTTLTVGTTLGVAAVLTDSAGRVLYDRTIGWTSSDTAIATVAGSGDVRARAIGDASITATYGSLRQVLRLHVAAAPPPPPAVVAKVTFAPYDTVLQVGDSTRLVLRAVDAAGVAISTAGRTVAWAVDAAEAPLRIGAALNAADSVRWAYATSYGTARLAGAVDGVGTTATIRVASPAPAAPTQVARVLIAVYVSDLVVGETSVVTATAYDASWRIVTTALRLQSANPVAGQMMQDSVSAGVVFGTLRASAPGIFSVIAETRDGLVYGQSIVTVRAAPAGLRAPVTPAELSRGRTR